MFSTPSQQQGTYHTIPHDTTLCLNEFTHLSGADGRAAVQTCVRPPHVIHEAFDDVQHLASLREQENPVTLQCPAVVGIKTIHTRDLHTHMPWSSVGTLMSEQRPRAKGKHRDQHLPVETR